MKNVHKSFPPGKLVAGRITEFDPSTLRTEMSLKASTVTGEVRWEVGWGGQSSDTAFHRTHRVAEELRVRRRGRGRVRVRLHLRVRMRMRVRVCA